MDSAEERMAKLGYKQEFKRDMNVFTNFAVRALLSALSQQSFLAA